MKSDLKKNKYCNRCHRELKDEKSKVLGFGPVCYEKFKKSKKIYLFEMEDYRNMEYTEKDLRIFNELYNHLSKYSNNIGMLGDYKKINHQIKSILKEYKQLQKKRDDIKIIINEQNQTYRIIVDDIETTYIYIHNYSDLIGKYFKKYI